MYSHLNFRLIVILIAIVAVLQSCNSANKNTQAPLKGKDSPPIPVSAVVITKQEVNTKISISGSVLPNEKVELRSEVAGRITGIYFKEGQQVKKGQVLIKIYDLDLKPQLEKIQLQQRLATKELERKKKVLEINGISEEEYEIAANQVSTLSADAQLIESALNKTTIIAPFSGVIGLRYVSEGEYVTSATLIATLQQVNPVKIEFDVPEKYGALLTTGASIDFTTTDANTHFSGNIYAIEQMVDMATRTFKVRAHSPNEKSLLKPGAFVKIELTLNKNKNAIQVPTQAVIASMKGQQVFVYHHGMALARIISSGIRNESTIQINEGLKLNDTVITSGLMQLKDSTKVKINSIQ